MPSLGAYAAGTRSGARRALADRADLLVRVLFYGLILIALGSLWRAAAREHGGSIAGYGGHQLWWYIAGAEAAFVPLPIRMIEDIGNEIGDGGVAVALLRPVSYVGFRAAVELGAGLVRLVLMVIVAITLGWVIIGAPPSLAGFALFVVAAALGVTCNVAAMHAVAAIAFWLQDAKSAWFLYSKLIFLLGGTLLPLEVLPRPLADTARALPFASMAYVPGRLLSGHVAPDLIALQLGWLVALAAAAAGAFAVGQRRLQVAGG